MQSRSWALAHALHLAKELPGMAGSSVLQPRGEQPTHLALHFIGMFVETSDTGVQVLLWAIRKHENQAKLIQAKLVTSECFLRGQSCQAEGFLENRRNLF